MYDEDGTCNPISDMEHPPECLTGPGVAHQQQQQHCYPVENCYVEYANGQFLPETSIPDQQIFNWHGGSAEGASFNTLQEYPVVDPQEHDPLNIFRPSTSPFASFNPSASVSFTNRSFGLVPDQFVAAAACDNSSPPQYDPLFHLNTPSQKPLFRELLQSLPQCYGFTGSEFDPLAVESNGRGLGYHDGSVSRVLENGVLDFGREISAAGSLRGRESKGAKHYVNERERRVDIKGKYAILRNHVPNPGKDDRTSVVEDAIGYIKELKRRVYEQKIMVERKRRMKLKRKRQKAFGAGEDEPVAKEDEEERFCLEPLKSSWIQRRSKDTEVDVRIVEDEVTIRLVQAKKVNCLHHVSRILEDLHLDLHHLAGGRINDHCSFLFNTKIYEGSLVYATAIADKLIEVADANQHSAPDSPA